MNTYGWLLLGQTVLALLALGLCGGWALWPFRRADRPYLWLAAPLAGVLALGGALALLYFFVGLPFRGCLWLGLALNIAATVLVLVRGRPEFPRLWPRSVGLAVALGAAYWGTVSCNKTAIDAREPTIAAMDGSDMFGYAITADWVRAHPAADRPRTDRPFEVMPYVNLYRDGGRPLAHLLAAAAGEARGTPSLFSYDWASGVLLAAGLLGFGGVFASGSLALVLLVAGAGTCNWLANNRTGYLGRSIAYPGALLLVGLFLLTVERLTWRRVAALAALGFAVAFSLAPVFATAALGLVTGSYVVALLVVYPLDRWRLGRAHPAVSGADGEGALPAPAVSFRARVLKPGAAAVLAFVVTVAPAFALYYAPRDYVGTPRAPADWPVVIPVALDLEPPALPLLKPETERKLLYGCAALVFLSAAVALRHRHPAALALLACALVVPVSWLLDQNLLYTFQGVVYPLTVAGAVLLAVPLAARRWGAARVAVLAVLVVAAVGLRVPQVRATADRYLYSAQPHRTVMRQSEAERIRALIGDEPVDVALGHYADNHVVLSELAAWGVNVRFRSPGWERSLGNWAKAAKCPPPDLLVPKSRFALVERNAYAPPGTERFVGRRLKLIEDRDAVTVMGVEGSQDMAWDAEWRPGVWIGNEPATFLIHNGTGREQAVRLLGTTSAGPAHPDRAKRTLLYRLGEQAGSVAAPGENTAAIPLVLAPGLNRVELRVAEPADPPPKPKQAVPMLMVLNWRLESADPR